MLNIPDSRHGSLHYGAHWSAPGASGHYVRSTGAQDWVRALERPDMAWGTARQARQYDGLQIVVTLAEIREAIADAQPQADNTLAEDIP